MVLAYFRFHSYSILLGVDSDIFLLEIARLSVQDLQFEEY